MGDFCQIKWTQGQASTMAIRSLQQLRSLRLEYPAASLVLPSCTPESGADLKFWPVTQPTWILKALMPWFDYKIIAIRLRYDYDPTTTYRARLLPLDAIRREQKMNMSIFRCSIVVVS